ncbi:MAG: dodecin family protein [Pseudomonadota bacterium]
MLPQVAEVKASSFRGFRDAIDKGLTRANELYEHIEGVWIDYRRVPTRCGQVNEYRVTLKLTYVLN